jgi:SAM-dependent methyltransferase
MVEATEHGPEWFEANRAFWDERVPIHVGSDFYRVQQFLDGEEQLRDFEIAEVGDVAGKTLFHPQCHFGQDTLCWARRGAAVTGLDFSPPAVDAARALAEQAGLDAEFVCAPVYDAVEAVGGRTFDVVYTGLGAICWLPDLERWASVMSRLCRSGGTFYLSEFHPVAYALDEKATEPELRFRHDYFAKVWHEELEGGDYADPSAVTEHDETWERLWTLGEVVSVIADAGFRIELLHEHETTLFKLLPFLEERDDGRYVLPEGLPSLPMMYSVRAVRD